MAGKRIVLLLALACVLAVNAAPATHFQKWLSNQSSAKVQADEDVDLLKTCLTEVAYRNCQPLQTTADGSAVTRGYTEAKMACCKSLEGDKFSSAVNDLFAEADTVGVCQYVEEYFTTPVSYDGKDASKIGSFKATCEMGEKADKCGAPYTDGLSLIVSGDILHYPKCAFMQGLSEASTIDGTCPLNYITAATPAKADLQASKDAPASEDAPVFMHGPCDIFAGTYHTVSRHTKIAQTAGTFQRVISTGATNSYKSASEPAKGSYVAKDGHVSLDFLGAQ